MSDIEMTVLRARELAGGATKGPWLTHGLLVFSQSDAGMVCEMSAPHKCKTVRHEALELSDPDAEWDQAENTMYFIAASRELVPQLCDIIDRLTRERDEWQRKALVVDNHPAIVALRNERDEARAALAVSRLWSKRWHKIADWFRRAHRGDFDVCDSYDGE